MRALKIALPLVGFVVGVLLVFRFLPEGAPLPAAEYLSLALLAGLDSICGGIRSGLRGKFRSDIFVSGFLVNMLLAVLFIFLGNQLGVDLQLAAVVTLGSRIFVNLSLIRREMLDRRQAGAEHLPPEEEPLGAPGLPVP
ncbi:MAG: small basic family protein [Armatimonadetes bacterium]|nr:small basic family protein [Armatimonadota bacterium]